MKRSIIAVDIFNGMGGLTRGLLDAGIKVIKGYDIDKKVQETYEKNNAGVKFYHKDISSLSGKEILDGIDRKNNLFLLAGCAPCQPFSRINRKTPKKDKRKILLLQFARLIEETKPDFVFMENVPGLKTGKGKKVFEEFLDILEKEKYFYIYDILDARDYGVPQKRKRLVLLASKHRQPEFPVLTNGPKSKGHVPFVTVRKTISKYPIIKGLKNRIIPNHEIRKLSSLNKLRLKNTKKDGGSRKDWPEKLILKCHKDYKGHSDVYGRMEWDKTAPTLTCKCTSISNGRFGHPSQNRAISVREAAALQTFKDNYIIYGKITEGTRWVGNAVPVKFVKKIVGVFLKNG